MNPKYACSDFTFPLLKHENVLALIAMMDFDGVDIGLFEGRSHLQPSSEFQSLKKNAETLLSKLNTQGLVVADVFLQCDNDFSVYAVNHPDKTRREFTRDWFLKTLEYAKFIGAQHVTILPGVDFGDDYEGDFNRAVDELGWYAERAKEYALILGVEAHVGSLVQQPKQAERLVKSTTGLTLTLDYTHFVRLGIPQEEYSILMPYASHFHARNAAPGHLQTVFSENKIDYQKVVKSMIDCGYKGFVGIEFVWQEWENGNRVDNVSETILLKNFIAEQWAKYCP